MFDFDRVYLALQDHKLQSSWSNLRLELSRLISFCKGSSDWYTLFIPQSELVITSFADIRKQEDILIRLLVDYTDRFYKALKAGYEGQFYQVTMMDDDHGSMLKLYQFEVEDTEEGNEYLKKLEVLKKLVEDGDIKEANKWTMPHMVAISFNRHLYYPLLSVLEKGMLPLKLRPLALGAESEVQFVTDLQKFYETKEGKEAIGNRSLYLLRNADREEKGLGFARAGNFYPDFLLWLIDEVTGQQWLSFVDPKGLRNIDLNDPKMGLYKEIKVLEKELGDRALILNAFILSPTLFNDLLNVGSSLTEVDLEDRHVIFMKQNDTSYLRKLFKKMAAQAIGD